VEISPGRLAGSEPYSVSGEHEAAQAYLSVQGTNQSASEC
jgi:hypothetical protein